MAMKKPKVTVDLASVRERLKLLKEDMKDNKISNEIVDDMVDDIRKKSWNWKKGKKFHPLTEEAIDNRFYLSRYNATHPDFSDDEPNLTITGQLLDSITTKTKVTTKGLEIKIDVSGKHRNYKTGDKKKKEGEAPKKKLTNKQIRNYLSKIDRDPLGVSNEVADRMVAFFETKIVERLAQIEKKRKKR